jgi:hypothetical protein
MSWGKSPQGTAEMFGESKIEIGKRVEKHVVSYIRPTDIIGLYPYIA